MAEERGLSDLENRLNLLEVKTFGPLPKDEEYPEVVSTMASLGGRLGSALGTRDRMMMVMKRLDELERYLDPAYGESLEVTDNVKLDLVLGREEPLRSFHHQLTTLNSLKHVLDSQHIKDCSNLEEELMGVGSRQRETEELATQQSTQIKNLLNQYNDIEMALPGQKGYHPSTLIPISRLP
ncbi:Dynactin subunit 3 [Chionoecetes opilio]|uniref:Dynactin subunit 3 n=1 Tax=Chionoecetes opilio TaxID=41210 RepID=A0A8J5D3M6_CHIOP|nr:Dynactin subunit 3 [Chionoecetes opilio]